MRRDLQPFATKGVGFADPGAHRNGTFGGWMVKAPMTNEVDPKLVDLILSNVAEGIFTVDRQFRITYFNRAAEQITGFPSENALGKFCFEVFRTPICRQNCPLRQSIRTGRLVKNFEIDILTYQGKRQAISVCTAPLIDEDGEFRGGVETFRDLSSIKELRREISAKYTFQDIISKNAKMRQIFETLPNIAQSDATVLIQGRSGTGKELFASAIHNISPREAGPLIKVNCGALPESLLESELFGHVKGAFTDAKNDRMGRFQAADGGTIFLDEIGDIPLSVQVKLLRVLQQREFEPLGSEKTVKVDLRVLAATNQDLEQLVAAGRFREDLYYRLNVILIQLPDLRERSEDIPLLVEHFLERFNNNMGRNIQQVDDEAMAVLMRYPFPGNVRELENVLEHAYIVSASSTIRPGDLPPHVQRGYRTTETTTNGGTQYDPFWATDTVKDEKQQLIECLERNRWSIPRAAREIGVHRTTLWRKVKRFGIGRP
jgi:PAS domain S-box-containing protein